MATFSESTSGSRGSDLAALDIGVFGIRGVPSTYGGFETFFTYLLPTLAEAGHSVTVYCRERPGEALEDYRGVRRVRTGFLRRNSLETISHGATASLAVLRARHDVVLVCNVANAPMTMLLRLLGTRVVLNTDGQEWLRAKWGPMGKAYFKQSARIARFAATALVSDCAAMAEVYRTEFNAPSTVIPYCWNTLEADAVDEGSLDKYGLTAGRYLVAGGRHVPENNLAEMAREFKETDSALELVVLGGSTYSNTVTQELQAIAASDTRIRLLGHVSSRANYKTIMVSSALYLHGHSVGGMNPALIEAMGAGCMIAALNGPFNREVLADAGQYFELRNGSLQRIIERVEFDVAGLASLRKRAHDRAKAVFGADAVGAAYGSLLREASQAPQRRRGLTISTPWDES